MVKHTRRIRRYFINLCDNSSSCVTTTGNSERFQSFNFETNFLKNKVLRLKAQHFHTKLPCQKPILRQIEWEVQNGPITKNGVLPATTFFLKKKCINNPNAHIPTFCKRWSFILRCFFLVSILKERSWGLD